MTIKYNVSGAKARNGKEIAPMAFSDRAEAERFAKYHEGLSVPQNLRKHPGSVQAFSTDHKDFAPTGEQTKAAEKFFASPAESATAKAVLSALIKSGDEFVMNSLHGQQFGRIHRRNFEEGGVERKSPPVTIVVDPKVFMAGVEEQMGPVQVLKLPIVLGGIRLLEKKSSAQEKLEWLQKANTLHRQVNILYVVDGYEVTVTWDENAISEAFHGQTVEEAIEKAMAGHDLDIRRTYHAHEFQYQMDRQLIALEAENENLRRQLSAMDNADLESAYEMGFRFCSNGGNMFDQQEYEDQRRSDLKELVSYNRSV